MFNLEELRMTTLEETDIEAIIIKRQKLVDKAISENDIQLLEQLSAIDKDNMKWLEEQRNQTGKQLAKLSKINKYLESDFQ